MSLSIALAGFLAGIGVLAGPATALSLNPDAGSPGIEDANTLHWILFIVIVITVVAVNLAILRAARPRTRHMGEPAAAKKGGQLKVGLGLGVVALAIFVTATVFSDQSRVVPVSTETVSGMTSDKQLEIEASGQQWLWRFNYPNGAFSYRRLVVPAGVTVALKLVSTDVIHTWNVPELTGKADAVPGKTNWVYFRADEEGVYTGQSAILSGQGYSTMHIEVSVVSPEQYELYVKALGKDIQEAQDAVEAQNSAAAGSAEDARKGEPQDESADEQAATTDEADEKVEKEAAKDDSDTTKTTGDVPTDE